MDGTSLVHDCLRRHRPDPTEIKCQAYSTGGIAVIQKSCQGRIGVCYRNCQVSVPIYLAHLRGFPGPIVVIVLDYTKRINPDEADSQSPHSSNGMSECPRQLSQVESRYSGGGVAVSCQESFLLLEQTAPTVAQGNVSMIFATPFHNLQLPLFHCEQAIRHVSSQSGSAYRVICIAVLQPFLEDPDIADRKWHSFGEWGLLSASACSPSTEAVYTYLTTSETIFDKQKYGNSCYDIRLYGTY